MSIRRVLVIAFVAALLVVLLTGCSAKRASAPVTPVASDVSTSTLPGTPTAPSTAAETTVSPRIPDVRGKTKASAEKVLHSAGFAMKSVGKANSAKVGTVVGQSPAAGQLALPGATVTITISTSPGKPSDSEVLGAFRKSYAHGFADRTPASRLLWKGRDKHGIWWAAVSVGPDSAGDAYAVCGYRKSRDRWVIQSIGAPDGSVLVSSDARPTPPADVVAAMRRHGVPIIAP